MGVFGDDLECLNQETEDEELPPAPVLGLVIT
jgi:hypothetical protein